MNFADLILIMMWSQKVNAIQLSGQATPPWNPHEKCNVDLWENEVVQAKYMYTYLAVYFIWCDKNILWGYIQQ